MAPASAFAADNDAADSNAAVNAATDDAAVSDTAISDTTGNAAADDAASGAAADDAEVGKAVKAAADDAAASDKTSDNAADSNTAVSAAISGDTAETTAGDAAAENAAPGDWIYNSGNGTITNSGGLTLTVKNLGNNELSITGNNGLGEFTSIDLTGEIKGANGDAFTITEIGYRAFFECKTLESINLPDSVKHIAMSAFSSCFSLRSIALPYNIEKIESLAFANCLALTSIEFSTSDNIVIQIGDNAFSGCRSIQTVFANTKHPPVLGKDVFSYTNDDFQVIVPRSWLGRYIIDRSWGDFDIRSNNATFGVGSTAHDYVDGICTICGAQAPSLAEAATKEPTAAAVTDRAVPTGDDSNIAIWAAFAGLAALGAAASMLYGKDKRKKQR